MLILLAKVFWLCIAFIITHKLEDIHIYSFIRFLRIITLFLAEATRSMSGLILKNTIKTHYDHLPAECIAYIRAACLECVGDPSPLIRATTGILVTTCVSRAAESSASHGVPFSLVASWPDLLPKLCYLLDSGEYSTVEVCRFCFTS